MQRDPKWGHLKDLHRALKLCKKALLWGYPSVQKLGQDLEVSKVANRTCSSKYTEKKLQQKLKLKPCSVLQAIVYEGHGACAAFLSNNSTYMAKTISFRGRNYYLPSKSISILPDCQTVVYNTQTVSPNPLALCISIHIIAVCCKEMS